MARLDLGRVKGDDGFSPTVETSKSGKVTTITITDEQGPHVATILDGEDGTAASGDMKKEVYDTNDNGIVDNAEKVNNHTVLKDVPANAVFTDTVFSGDYDDLTNKPAIPDELSDLSDDSTHRLVTDTEKTTWSGKQDALTAGSNITISGGTISATDTTYSDATTSASGLMSSTDKTKLNGIAAGAEVNVQANWNETDTDSDSYIQNKPTIPEDMQYSTMPTASADNLDKIIQYVGATNITYTNGYFYKCVSDGESTPTYSWENVTVQAGGGGASYTAGTNISIDSNNAINCTIPYLTNNDDRGISIKGNTPAGWATMVGWNSTSSWGGNAFGCSANAGYEGVAIGKGAKATDYSIAIGTGANSQSYSRSIAIGNSATTTKANQVMFGSTNFNITEIAMYTSNGVKVMATESYVDNLVGNINTVLATLTTPSNGGNA